MKKAFQRLISVMTFFNNYKAVGIGSVLLIFSICLHAQVNPYDSTKIRQVQSAYGFEWKNGAFDGPLVLGKGIPNMSYKDSGAIAYYQGKVYLFNGTAWVAINSGGSDATKRNISDTILTTGTATIFSVSKDYNGKTNNYNNTKEIYYHNGVAVDSIAIKPLVFDNYFIVNATGDTVFSSIRAGVNIAIVDSVGADGKTYKVFRSTGGGGGGTVTSASVVSTNGLAGTVANPTTTPAITLSTTITGILKGNGTAISAATSGTDYVNIAQLGAKVDSGGAYVKTVTLTNTGVLHATPTYTYNSATHNYDITQNLATQSAYKAFTRAFGTGLPSWNSLDSNYWGGQWGTQVRASADTLTTYKFLTSADSLTLYIVNKNGSKLDSAKFIGSGGVGTSTTTNKLRITATAGQTAFTFAGLPASVNDYDIFINGMYCNSTYFTTAGTTVTFSSGLTLNDVVDYAEKK